MLPLVFEVLYGIVTVASFPAAITGSFMSPREISMPSADSVHIALNPARSINWYLLVIRNLPCARSTADTLIH